MTSSICSFPAARTSKANTGSSKFTPGEIAACARGNFAPLPVRLGECLRVRVATQEVRDPKASIRKSRVMQTRLHCASASESIGVAMGPQATAVDAGPVLEHISFWDPQSDLWVERDVSALIGCKRDGGRIVRKLSAFNYFTGMTGKGGARAPVLYNGKEFRIDVYNLEEEQNGFHRGCDEDEIWFQFRGHSLNHTEWGAPRTRPRSDDLHPARCGPSDYRQPRFSAHGALQPQAGSPEIVQQRLGTRNTVRCSVENLTSVVGIYFTTEARRTRRFRKLFAATSCSS